MKSKYIILKQINDAPIAECIHTCSSLKEGRRYINNAFWYVYNKTGWAQIESVTEDALTIISGDNKIEISLSEKE